MDPLEGIFGRGMPRADRELQEAARRAREAAKRATPLPQLRGRTIDGVKYLRADDVVAVLEAALDSRSEALVKKIRRFTDAD